MAQLGARPIENRKGTGSIPVKATRYRVGAILNSTVGPHSRRGQGEPRASSLPRADVVQRPRTFAFQANDAGSNPVIRSGLTEPHLSMWEWRNWISASVSKTEGCGFESHLPRSVPARAGPGGVVQRLELPTLNRQIRVRFPAPLRRLGASMPRLRPGGSMAERPHGKGEIAGSIPARGST